VEIVGSIPGRDNMSLGKPGILIHDLQSIKES
jgi:hypothetical protein